MNIDTPRVFISYSWDSTAHKDWVLALAMRLRVEGGTETILDEWHLKPGQDRFVFMEQQVTTSDFVLMVCTPEYASKANKRSGGAGYEATIITPELAGKTEQTKFVPILRRGSWEASSPSWLQSRIYIDLRGDPYQEEQFRSLLIHLHSAHPLPPLIGPKPDFTLASNAVAPPSGKIFTVQEQTLIYRLPRGFVAVEPLLGKTQTFAPMIATYFDYQGESLGGTHYHESYLRFDSEVQSEKLNIPFGDRLYAHPIFSLMIDIRGESYTLTKEGLLLCDNEPITLPQYASIHSPGSIPIPVIPPEYRSLLASAPVRDLAAEAYQRAVEYDNWLAPEFKLLVARIRREARIHVYSLLGETHPAYQNIEEIVTRYKADLGAHFVLWLEELSAALSEAARCIESKSK